MYNDCIFIMARGETWNVYKLHAESRWGDVVECEINPRESIYLTIFI